MNILMFLVKRAALGLSLLVGILIMALPAQAMSDAHQQGMSLAKDFTLPQPGNPDIVPGYAGTELPQSHINPHDLGQESFKIAQSNEASQLLQESFEKGDKYVIDPHTDPLIVAANKVIAHPQKALDETIEEIAEEGEFVEETRICEESGEEALEECIETRVVTVREIPDTKHRVQLYGQMQPCISGNFTRNVVTGVGTSDLRDPICLLNPLPASLHSRVIRVERAPEFSCGVYNYSFNSSYGFSSIHTDNYWLFSLLNFSSFNEDGTFSMKEHMSIHGFLYTIPVYLNFDIFYKRAVTEDDVSERIVNNCQSLEEKVEKGLCSYEDVIITEGPQTRIINDHPVTRDWWCRKKVYRCHYPAKNDCAALRAKGCYQINSVCKEKVGEVCVVWEQTYKCPSGKKIVKSFRSSNKANPFCLSGDCADKSYAPNKDFAETMSLMSVLKEAGDDLRNFGSIFKGLDWRCTRHCIGFKDCCGNGRGWGVSLNLASCDKKEQTLAELRKKNRCIQVGTYCAEKELGICIRKKTTFCCYDTKLAKIVQEQGKRQLGLGFGDPKQPQCQGLTIEQLALLDFSKIDFSDMLADIVGSTKIPSSEKLMSGIQQSMQDRGTLLKVKEKVGAEPITLTQDVNQPTQALPRVLNNSVIPLPPKPNDTKVKPNTPLTKSPQDHQIQGRSHGQF
ncbi:MAG: conjugal transfer protein TraN [Candidatus Paracaedibacter sp.]